MTLHSQKNCDSINPDSRTRDVKKSLPVLIIVSIFFILIVHRAWLCDDAYITFRTVDNLVHGYKLTWNTIERVQAYTHPLWMLLNSLFYYFTRDIYATSLAVSLLTSTTAVLLYVIKLTKNPFQAFMGGLVLSLSNAFVDYSTSGLENPLTNLLLVIFYILFFSLKPSNKKIFLLSLTASLAGVNRLDTMLLYFPALVFALWELRSLRSLFTSIAGQFPLFLWECFSLFYYGFPFPNTYYAKLNTGISSTELLNQGMYYFQNSFLRDPLTLVAISTGILLVFFSRQHKSVAAAFGIILYLLYILKIGGDFMSGRFYAAPLLCTVILVSQATSLPKKFLHTIIITAAILLLGLQAHIPTYLLLPQSGEPITDEHGITDERVWYFRDFALFSTDRKADLALSAGKNGAKAKSEAGDDLYVIAVNNTGVFGYYAGPSVYVIDQLALSDALLARLPSVRKINWRIGHFTRKLPEGYISRIYQLGKLGDSDLDEFYEKLHIIISGRLSDPQRLVEIWKMNTGQYNRLIKFDTYRYPDMVYKSLDEMEALAATSLEESTPTTSRYYFNDSGLEIDMGTLRYIRSINICLDSDDDYHIQYLSKTGIVAQQDIQAASDSSIMQCSKITVPQKAAKNGFSHIRIFPTRGNGDYSSGGLKIKTTAP